MQKIQDLAMQNYTDNMEFFEKNHEKLHSKMLALETILDNGSIKQKYDLEYKDDYFDVVELSSGNLLYSQNSNDYGTRLCEEISMKKDEQVCETFYKINFDKESVKKINKSSPLTIHANLAPIIEYYNDNVNSNMQFKQIYKFMFLGLGLATHIKKIMDKIKPRVTFLTEDDVELFRLSLFTCNYKDALSSTMVIFSIGENIEEYNASLSKFYQTELLFNQYLKFSLFSDAYQNKVKSIQEFIVSRPEKCYSHNRMLYKNKKALQRIYDNYRFLELKKRENETFFKDKPVIVLGAGPSLQENIEWISQKQENFIIIAVFSALKTLQNHKISPDIVVQMDENIPIWENIINSFDDFDFLKSSIFLLTASVPDLFLEKFDSKNIFLFEDRTHYKQQQVQIAAASVGELAYSISLILNAKDTYLLGLDLSIRDDGTLYAQDHYHAKKIDLSDKNSIPTNTHLHTSTLKSKGNFRESVFSTAILAASIPLVNNYTKRFKSSTQNVFNLCDGAYFKDTIPLHIKDIKQLLPINKKDVLSHLNKILSNYSTSSFTKEEINSIEVRKEQISTIRTYIENFDHSPTSNTDMFTHLYRAIANNIIKLKKSELQELLLVYILNTGDYIIDFFNTQELEDTKKHTKKIKKIIITQLNQIIDCYENILNNNTDEQSISS